MESRFLGEISTTSGMQIHHPYGRKWNRTKEPLDEGERGEQKAGLHFNSQKTKIMTSGLITSWQVEEEKVEIVTEFMFLVSKITVDIDCSHEMKRHLLLRRQTMINLDNVLKSKDITLPPKICIVKGVVFPVVMYRCECWSIKKAEHQRTDVSELWSWQRLFRAPWTARRLNQSILRDIIPEYSLKELLLSLELQYFSH